MNFLITILFIILSIVSLNAQQKEHNVKVGLALSGGGANGIAHIGVLQALEEQGIEIDAIAGASMGSIVGGLYAAGYSPADIQVLVNEIKWDKIFMNKPKQESILVSEQLGLMDPLIRLRFDFWDLYIPSGLNNGQRISDLLFKLTAPANYQSRANFDSLKIPFRALAVDASTGETLALDRGELSQAIHASMAIPVYFQPVQFQDKILLDGGITNILPADIVKEMGADVVIASDVVKLFPIGEKPKHVLDIAEHSIDIASRKLKNIKQQDADLIIKPKLESHSSFDYTNLDSLIQRGYEKTISKMDTIKQIIQYSPSNRAPKNDSNKNKKLSNAIIKDIITVGNKKVRSSLILREFNLKNGTKYNHLKVQQGIENVYATGLFEKVWLELTSHKHNTVTINIHVLEKYPRTINFGLNYNNMIGLSGMAQIVHFNLFGWGERFMPFARFSSINKKGGVTIVNDRLFATPITIQNEFYYENQTPFIYNQAGNNISNLTVDKWTYRFGMGVQPIRKLLIMSGIILIDSKIHNNQTLQLEGEYLRYGNWFETIIYDNTNQRYHPTRGIYFEIRSEQSFTSYYGAKSYIKTKMKLDYYYPLDSKQIIKMNLLAGIIQNSPPIYEKFRVGGIQNFPGFNFNELWFENVWSINIGYEINLYKSLYFLTGLNIAQGSDSFLKTNDPVSGMLFSVRAESPIGPFSISCGLSQENRSRLYASYGYSF